MTYEESYECLAISVNDAIVTVRKRLLINNKPSVFFETKDIYKGNLNVKKGTVFILKITTQIKIIEKGGKNV